MTDPVALERFRAEARARVRKLSFADPVTNVCAGEGNPLRHAYFVRVQGHDVLLTDRKGEFAAFGCDVIFPGHLSPEESARLFEPIWQAKFGRPADSASSSHE